MKEFDYYTFIDYSENLIGYCIIENRKLKELLPKISKFAHYKNIRYKRSYLKSIKSRIEKERILSYFIKHKIREMYKNADIYADVLDFIKKHNNCIIFISIDNRQYGAFNKLMPFGQLR